MNAKPIVTSTARSIAKIPPVAFKLFRRNTNKFWKSTSPEEESGEAEMTESLCKEKRKTSISGVGKEEKQKIQVREISIVWSLAAL